MRLTMFAFTLFTIAINYLGYWTVNPFIIIFGYLLATILGIYCLCLITLFYKLRHLKTDLNHTQLLELWLFHPKTMQKQLINALKNELNEQILTLQLQTHQELKLSLYQHYAITPTDVEAFMNVLKHYPIPESYLKAYVNEHGPHNLWQFLQRVNSFYYPKFEENKRNLTDLAVSCVDCDKIILDWVLAQPN